MPEVTKQRYIRPLLQTGAVRPKDALVLAQGWCWFTDVEILGQGVFSASSLTDGERLRLTGPRPSLLGLSWEKPHLMGILNVTPDSFSDGGKFHAPLTAQTQAHAMVGAGASLIDIGGESTRPGAALVPQEDEIARTAPVIAALQESLRAPVSIDTRKAAVAQAALSAGARLVNDVSAMTFDPTIVDVAIRANAPICLMHAQGDPKTMHLSPTYGSVVTEVYDFLEDRIRYAQAQGMRRDQIVVDPGIGFGKTLQHNLTLLRNISLFHSLGCVVLLGASRKRFIGTISGVNEAEDRVFGSVAVALAAAREGVQILRVHDIAATTQALALDRAICEDYDDT